MRRMVMVVRLADLPQSLGTLLWAANREVVVPDAGLLAHAELFQHTEKTLANVDQEVAVPSRSFHGAIVTADVVAGAAQWSRVGEQYGAAPHFG